MRKIYHFFGSEFHLCESRGAKSTIEDITETGVMCEGVLAREWKESWFFFLIPFFRDALNDVKTRAKKKTDGSFFSPECKDGRKWLFFTNNTHTEKIEHILHYLFMIHDYFFRNIQARTRQKPTQNSDPPHKSNFCCW